MINLAYKSTITYRTFSAIKTHSRLNYGKKERNTIASITRKINATIGLKLFFIGILKA